MLQLEEYDPELGQACFGQPSQRYECPEYVEPALQLLASFMEEKGIGYQCRFMRLDGESDHCTESAFRNIGEHFKNDTFEVCSYDWNTDVPQPYNFRYKDINVSWYKYLGRGMSINREVSIEETWSMLKECMESLCH